MLHLTENCTISRDGSDVLVVAEIGQNHQGSLSLAKEMILQAKLAGCNAVKFQKSCLSAKFTSTALERSYDNPNSWGRTYGQHKAHLEFSIDDFKELKQFARQKDIIFGASAMDEVSLTQLQQLQVDFIKIGSGDANNIPLLKRAARLQCPLIVSTGMQSMTTIRQLIDIICGEGDNWNVAILHCVSSYPTAVQDCALENITLLRKEIPRLVIGYSGHELGIEVSTAAVCLGARVIERHFTLNRLLKGSDHQCSLEPQEMKAMIGNIRKLKALLDSGAKLTQPGEDGKGRSNKWLMEQILGANIERIESALSPVMERIGAFPCEMACKMKLGKSLVATEHLTPSTLLREEHISVKVSEPVGIAAEHYERILGCTLRANVLKDMPIQWEHIQENNRPLEL